jgi:IPT/TIG domain.
VTISGSGFSGATSITFAGAAAAFNVQSNVEVTATVPAAATSGTISVMTPGGTATSSGTFTVTVIHPAPIVSAFSPPRGVAGTAVTISGSDFTGVSSVKFNGMSATFTFVSDAQLTAYVPSGATSGKISAATASGTGTSTALFTVIQKPSITGFTPAKAVTGSQVTISGSSFTYVTSVKFNGVTASFTVNNDTQIVATVPAAATTGKITVANPAGTATSSMSFWVDGTPVITAFTPFHGMVGTSVTITGSDIMGATGVTFGGVAATFVVTSNTQINAIVPTAAVTGKIGVTTSKGTVLSDTDFIVHGILANGDSNADGVVDAADVFYLVNAMFGGGPESMANADVNGDGVVTVADVFYLINYVFLGGPAPV